MWILIVLLLFGAGCAPTVEQQRSARVEALQLELDATLAGWKADATRGHFGTSANAARALVARYDLVYERWGLRADSLTQATLAYSVAAAVRVDDKELSADEANRLVAKMRTDLERDRAVVSAKRSENTADRDAAMLTCWKAYWAANHSVFAASSRNPVRCEVNSSAVDGRRVNCR